jgi:ribosomal protein S18 acetylase RimI-like enzyme
MSENLVIRAYEPRDEEHVIRLWLRCDLVVPWNNPRQDIERKLRVNPELFLVGEIGGKLVATCMAGYEGHRGWVNYLATDPDYTRRGIGAKMMEEVEARLLAMGCPKINLQVRAGNSAIVEFYEAVGYKLDDILNMGKRLKEDEPFTPEEGKP